MTEKGKPTAKFLGHETVTRLEVPNIVLEIPEFPGIEKHLETIAGKESPRYNWTALLTSIDRLTLAVENLDLVVPPSPKVEITPMNHITLPNLPDPRVLITKQELNYTKLILILIIANLAQVAIQLILPYAFR